MKDNESLFGDAIYSYTRTQAIADGVLADLTQFEVTRQQWRLHVACTSAVWALIEAAVRDHGKDYQGILHDLYMLARIGISGASNTDTVHFRAIVGRTTHAFQLHCGPGDDSRPVLTLMLEWED